MTRRLEASTALLSMLCCTFSVAEARDTWDLAGGDDHCSTTTAEMFHGMPPQIHDLEESAGSWDVDFIRTKSDPSRSYEFRISGSAANSATVTLTTDSDFTMFAANSVHTDSLTKALRWSRNTTGGNAANCARIAATGSLTNSAQYTVEFRETTLFCPRYNNTGTQTSVLILKNASLDPNAPCQYYATFSDDAGTVVGFSQDTMEPGVTRVISLPTVPGLAGTKGSAQIAHTCGVGGISGKLVAMEPATGFSFDTICLSRQP